MRHILLLGAGFSRNWGGPLASEFFNYLICQDEVNNDRYLMELLWKHKTTGGFENALSEVQASFAKDPSKYDSRLKKLQGAVSNVFDDINKAFFDTPDMEFQQDIKRLLRTFLARFDAIFTLNQDVLLEHHYFRHVDLAGRPGRWSGAQLPGLRRIPNATEAIDPSCGKDTWVPLEQDNFRIEDGLQPYIKLHGSSNWIDSEGGSLLVIGGDKSRTIQSHPVLAWYFEQFRLYLSDPSLRLFVIGYGFRDTHVNEVIIEAVSRGLKFFVIDPSGIDVVQHANPSFGGQIYAPNALDDAFKQGLIGVSQRGLGETFRNDLISHKNVMDFFG